MSNRGATGAGTNKSRALVNSGITGRSTTAQVAGGNKGNGCFFLSSNLFVV